MKRAIRRHHRDRIKNKVKWHYGGYHSKSGEHNVPWPDEDRSRIINSRQKCSCPFCCGNPRRVRGRKFVTKQELLAGYDGKLYR